MWDYEKVDGGIYNKLPLETQLEILNEYYTIGGYFHWIQPNSSRPTSRDNYRDYNCIIKRYVLTCITGIAANWYILEVDNIDDKTIHIRNNKKIEACHPGFFKPSCIFMRDKKLNEIL